MQLICKRLNFQDYRRQRIIDVSYKTLWRLPTSFGTNVELCRAKLAFAHLKVVHYDHYYRQASFLAKRYHLLLIGSAQGSRASLLLCVVTMMSFHIPNNYKLVINLLFVSELLQLVTIMISVLHHHCKSLQFQFGVELVFVRSFTFIIGEKLHQ